MKVLICGSRDWTDYTAVLSVVSLFDRGTIIIEGGQRGADKLALKAGHACELPVVEIPANWDLYRGRAGPIRNQWMLDIMQPDLAVAFPLPQSIGTVDMMRRAKAAGIEVWDATKVPA